jgi:hypothetical protein
MVINSGLIWEYVWLMVINSGLMEWLPSGKHTNSYGKLMKIDH